MVNALPVLLITAGIYTMVVMSIERVRCVLPARGQHVSMPNTRSIGKRGTIIALAVIWVLAVILAVPTAVNFDVGVAHDTNNTNHTRLVCHSTWNSFQTSINSLFLLVVSYILPMAVLYVNYGRLAAYLWKQGRTVAAASVQPPAIDAGSQNTSRAGPSAATLTSRSTLRTIKMLGAVSILFLVSWAPYFTIMTIEVICFCLIKSIQ